MKYTIRISNITRQTIAIKAELDFDLSQPERIIQLPVWRPGRYERGDFAQYIINFQVHDPENNPISFKKINSSAWQLFSPNNKVIVSYEFYAAILNAGSTWVDEKQLYVNPVNCLVYIPGNENVSCELKLEIPENYVVATSLKETERHTYKAVNFHELVDSPFIASNSLQHFECQYAQTDFHFWFSGECKPHWPTIEKNISAIIEEQVKTVGNFPSEQYHVLTHVLPYPAYHGVEHAKSTVLTLGPAHEFMEPSLYNEFLGIFSHELFHAWNVKTIRPADFFEYDYSKENYSELGYIYEGVTTYYGDLFALRSNVFSWDFFAGLLADWITRHFHNYGRKVYSVSQSSFDTWIDGYKSGTPNRKVNMYNEGALCALMADILIRHSSGHVHSLDDVIRSMNHEFGSLKKGYTRNDYKRLLEHFSGINFDGFFASYLEGTDDYGTLLFPLLNELGILVQEHENKSTASRRFGIKLKNDGGKQVIDAIAPDSPADIAGLRLNEEIRAINGITVGSQSDKWFSYFEEETTLEITLSGNHGTRTITIHPSETTYYPYYVITKNPAASENAKSNFEKWAKAPF